MNKRYCRYGNYDLQPYTKIAGYDEHAVEGYDDITIRLMKEVACGKRVIVCDLYPGVDKEEVIRHLSCLNPALVIESEDCALREEELNELFKEYLTDDRVFGFMCHKKLADCFIKEKIEDAQRRIREAMETAQSPAQDPAQSPVQDPAQGSAQGHAQGAVLVIGVGAGLITRGDVYLYFDLARWEIQLRYRAGMANWKCTNYDAPNLTKIKRGFFVEWRLADKHKRQHFEDFDYVVDTNRKENPKMITGEAFRHALDLVSQRPFRMQPYFDPGVWGGHWMQQNFGLGEDEPNYAWSFDGVPEENSLNLMFGEILVELPCMDLVLYRPRQLLGEKVHARFGPEFPIRFDMLDTMGGGNLSLQVHPLTEYIQDTFGMNYTQDESYYILDCEEGSCVYLGVKEGTDPEEMARDLKRAEKGGYEFPAEKYVNKIPVKKHDHVLIPAGTVHCSGANTMVLEISATPYIFTFKMWDWGRVGLDGIPRPIHVDHGLNNIQWERTLPWLSANLLHQEKVCREEEGILVERTGLHQREFIDTHRYMLTKPVKCHTNDSVHVLNLVEGEKALIESPNGAFAPFEVHYAETFIIPACVEEYIINPTGADGDKKVGVIAASVRG